MGDNALCGGESAGVNSCTTHTETNTAYCRMRTQSECPPYGQLQQWCLFVLGISQPIPYNPRLHSQHGLILFNLHPRNHTPGLCTRKTEGFVFLYHV